MKEVQRQVVIGRFFKLEDEYYRRIIVNLKLWDFNILF